jgi:hypothetical protein
MGSGDLYINRVDPTTGLSLGLAGPFECSKFEIKPNTDLKEQTSKGRDTYGQVIATVALNKPADFSITLTEMDKDGLTLALLGTQTAISQGAGTVSDEIIALTVAKVDKWQGLSKKNINAAGFVVTNAAASTTYVEGTDYTVNRVLGKIKVHSDGAIPSTESIKVDFAYAAYEGTLISGATQAQVKAEFVLDGKNHVDYLPVICTAYEVVLAPDSAFDFLSDNFGEVTLKGRANTPTGKTEPFTVELRSAAA